jgi:TetR/AcrR family transcriptional repressor of nem operon
MSRAPIATGRRPAGDALGDVFLGGVTRLIDVLAAVSPGATAAEQRTTAIARAATMMGAIVMSRATMADPALSDEILAVVRRKLTDAKV